MLTKIENGIPIQVTERRIVVEDGTKHDVRAIAQAWSDQELEALGLYRAEVMPPSPGEGYSWDGSEWQPDPVDPAEALAAWRAETGAPFADIILHLALAGWITEAEFDDWLARTALPADVRPLIDALPTLEERLKAKRFALHANRVERNHWLVLAFAEIQRAKMGISEDAMALEVEDLFRAAMQIEA